MTREVLKEIKSYQGLPFTSRWLITKFGAGKTAFALRELGSMGVLDAHPPLLEKGKGLVSQAEHSVIVQDKPIVYTKLDDD
jgi:methionyl aminopeptidase